MLLTKFRFEYDFYLCAHSAIQGTARPVHYHVLMDEAQCPVNEFQRMIYQMSYQYMRSTTPVSMCKYFLTFARAYVLQFVPKSLLFTMPIWLPIVLVPTKTWQPRKVLVVVRSMKRSARINVVVLQVVLRWQARLALVRHYHFFHSVTQTTTHLRLVTSDTECVSRCPYTTPSSTSNMYLGYIWIVSDEVQLGGL